MLPHPYIQDLQWSDLQIYSIGDTTLITIMPRRKPKKRKPRAKRKIISATQPDNIPYEKVRGEWIDILSDSGWAD